MKTLDMCDLSSVIERLQGGPWCLLMVLTPWVGVGSLPTLPTLQMGGPVTYF